MSSFALPFALTCPASEYNAVKGVECKMKRTEEEKASWVALALCPPSLEAQQAQHRVLDKLEQWLPSRCLSLNGTQLAAQHPFTRSAAHALGASRTRSAALLIEPCLSLSSAHSVMRLCTRCGECRAALRRPKNRDTLCKECFYTVGGA